MISDINSRLNNLEQSIFQPEVRSQNSGSTKATHDSQFSFDDEDQAIISAQAKLQNELDKFNSGGDNIVDLVTASVMARFTTSAEVNVINIEKDMFDTILSIGE